MAKFFRLVYLLAIAVLAIAFVSYNPLQVSIDFLVWQADVAVGALLVCAFVAGLVVGVAALGFEVLRLSRKLKKQVARTEPRQGA